MTGSVVDVFDILRPVRAKGSAEVHLAPYTWATRDDITTLCEREISATPPSDTFQRRGCFHCASRALSVGIGAVREDDRAVLNLSRFIDRSQPSDH